MNYAYKVGENNQEGRTKGQSRGNIPLLENYPNQPTKKVIKITDLSPSDKDGFNSIVSLLWDVLNYCASCCT